MDISPTLSLNSLVEELHNSNLDCHKDEIIQLALMLEEITRLECKLKAIQICLGPALNIIHFNDLESTIFSQVLPFTNRLFTEVLTDIEREVGNKSVSNINNLLQVCLEILSCCENTLNQVIKFEPLNFEHVCSLPKNLTSILLSSFDHCRTSDVTYGETLSSITEALTALFHKSYDVQTNLLSFLTDGVKFHCTFDEELQTLLEVMEMFEHCGEVLMTLGIKPLVQQWKGYTQLAGMYKEAFQTSLDVAKPIRFLANDLGLRLLKTLLVKENDIEGSKLLVKELKVGAFVLKIIVKLCEQFAGYLGNCHKELIALLVHLYGFSKPFLSFNGTPSEIIEFVERNITVGVGPLIAALHDDRGFVEAFENVSSMNYSHSIESDTEKAQRVGQLLLCVAVMKKLITIDREILQLWMKSGVSFVEIIFNLIEQGSIEFELDITIERTETPGNSDLYETVLTHTTAYLLTTTTEESYGELEKYLEARIIQRKYWVAVMASDIFLLLSRYGNSDLKLQQAKYFLSKSISWPSDYKHTPEWIFLRNFTKRLLKLIPPETACNLLANYPASVNAELGCDSMSGSSGADVDYIYQSLQNFLSTDNTPDCKNYNNMIGLLLSMGSFQPHYAKQPKFQDLLLAITKFWQLCEHILLLQMKDLGHWFDKLLADLTSSSCNVLDSMDNSLINLILRCLCHASRKNSTIIKLVSISFLKSLASIELQANKKQSQVFKSIVCLFSSLIEDGDPVISSNALECFECFANVTVHTSIISTTGQQNPLIQNLITSFLQRHFLSQSSECAVSFPKRLESIDCGDFKRKCEVNLIDSKSIALEGNDSNRIIKYCTERNQSLCEKLILLNKNIDSIIKRVLKTYEENNSDKKYECDMEFLIDQLERCIKECTNQLKI